MHPTELFGCIMYLTGFDGIRRNIAQFGEFQQLCPYLFIEREAERILVYERLQIILIRHLHRVIGGIDPLDGEFHSLAAPEQTSQRPFHLRSPRRQKDGIRVCWKGIQSWS